MKAKFKTALEFATLHHEGQKYWEHDYMYHINMATQEWIDFLNDEQMIALILHDIVEDTEVTIEDLVKLFGEDVAILVWAVTDNQPSKGKALPREGKKEYTMKKLDVIRDAIPVKLCDRIANIKFSSVSSQKKHKMYMKEHEVFYSLYKEGECDELWDVYNNLIIK